MTRPLEPIASRLPRSAVNAVKYRLVSPLLLSNLDALGVLWATDKAMRHHGYTSLYAKHLGRSRRSTRCVLEIGIGGAHHPDQGGNSLYMWKSYFRRASVFGVDIHRKELRGVPDVVPINADQSDRAALQQVVRMCPPFDLIIDDGSHIGTHILTSFSELFPALRPGGWYVIEDLETSYWPDFGGGPRGTPDTGVALIKELLDDLNIGPQRVAAIHAYPGIAFIRKAERPRASSNGERGAGIVD